MKPVIAPDDSKAASRLLETLLVFSAGLCRRWERETVLASYQAVHEFQANYRAVDRALQWPRDPGSIHIDALAAVLARYSARDLVVATAHHGHFIAFLCACARRSIPLSVCYKDASPSYLDAAARSGLALVKLNPGPRAVFERLDRDRADGRYVVIMMDGPFDSRRRYGFLGYDVAASPLASLYARRTGSALLPLVPTLSHDLTIGCTMGAIICDVRIDMTQGLLDFLQSVILREPAQHQWVATSILMSDPAARQNAFQFIEDALSWRNAH